MYLNDRKSRVGTRDTRIATCLAPALKSAEEIAESYAKAMEKKADPSKGRTETSCPRGDKSR
jgi:hypothetical protein